MSVFGMSQRWFVKVKWFFFFIFPNHFICIAAQYVMGCFHSWSLNQATASSSVSFYSKCQDKSSDFLWTSNWRHVDTREVFAGTLFVCFTAVFPRGRKFAKKELELEPAEIFKPLQTWPLLLQIPRNTSTNSEIHWNACIRKVENTDMKILRVTFIYQWEDYKLIVPVYRWALILFVVWFPGSLGAEAALPLQTQTSSCDKTGPWHY